MRASAWNTHVSGAERLLGEDHVEGVLSDLFRRALSSYRTPDEISITVDYTDPEPVSYLRSLDVKTVIPSSCEEARDIAKGILGSNGVSPAVAGKAIYLLCSGPTPEGTNMRGAILMDALTGERLESDIRRGIRVSRIDYTEDARKAITRGLKDCGIYHERVIDALAVATKVASRTETIAELCWSDNPDYTTGYIASRRGGYVRVANLKEKGSVRGGRVFFVNPEGLDLAQYIHYLERQPLIIDSIGNISKPESVIR